jgi:hypothetical protein
MQECQERSGFLFAHGCDQPATSMCAECGKTVCQRHTRVTTRGDCCVSCAKEAGVGEQADDDRYDRDPYWYAGRHYHGYHYYDERDRRAFERRRQRAEREGFEDDFDGS